MLPLCDGEGTPAHTSFDIRELPATHSIMQIDVCVSDGKNLLRGRVEMGTNLRRRHRAAAHS